MPMTIRLDDALFRETKILAVKTGRAFTAVVEDALREAISREQSVKRHRTIRLTTVSGQGLCDGVDLDHGAELLDLMERPDSFFMPIFHQPKGCPSSPPSLR